MVTPTNDFVPIADSFFDDKLHLYHTFGPCELSESSFLNRFSIPPAHKSVFYTFELQSRQSCSQWLDGRKVRPFPRRSPSIFGFFEDSAWTRVQRNRRARNVWNINNQLGGRGTHEQTWVIFSEIHALKKNGVLTVLCSTIPCLFGAIEVQVIEIGKRWKPKLLKTVCMHHNNNIHPLGYAHEDILWRKFQFSFFASFG